MRGHRLVLLACCACGAPRSSTLHPPTTHVAPDASALVAAWATAVGGADRLATIGAVHAHGRAEQGGLTGDFDRWETVRGERRDDVELGSVAHTVRVFDGSAGWLVDRNRWVRDLDGPELVEQITLAYLGTWAPIVPDRRAGTVTRRGDTLVLEPEGGRTVTVTFDPASHLPETLTRRDAEKTRVVTLADWRAVSGVRFPFTITDSTGDPHTATVLHVETIDVDPATGAAPFVRPPDGPRDARLTADRALVPIEIVHGLIVAQAQVNGSAPLSFLVDTGADVTVINTSRLGKLGLHAIGELATGAGGGDVAMSYLEDVSFTLPGAALAHQIATAIPLDSLEPLFGHPIDGVLGYDFLSRFVVEIDYDRRTMTLSDPATFVYAGKGVALPITLEGSTPNATATIGVASRPSVTGRFIVDTGCSCEVSFNAPFWSAHRLLETAGDVIRPPSGTSRGAGGVTENVLGHVASLTIAGATVARPGADFAQDKIGARADPDWAGLLGGRLWRRFVVTFDYAHKRMWLAPNAHLAETDSAVGTGILWQMTGGDIHDLEVMAVLPGSPGAEAGIAVGDRLVSIDGKPAGELTVDQAQLPRARPGEPHTYVVRRAGAPITLTVTPRALY